MTVTVVIAACALVLLAMVRANPVAARRGIAYWWTWSTFGLTTIYSILAAAGIVSDTDSVLGYLGVTPSAILSVVMVGRAVRQRGIVSFGALLCAAPVVVSLAWVLSGASLLTPVLWLVLIAGTLVVPNGGYDVAEIRAGLFASFRAVMVALVALALLIPGQLIGDCRVDKCSVWGYQIGADGSANGLGMSIAFLTIAVAVGLSWQRCAVMLVGAAALVDLCSSRSAFTIVVTGVLAILVERTTRGRTRTVLRGLLLTAVAACIVGIAVIPWPADAFTLRGSLWIRARELITENPLLGWGSSYWVRQPETATLIANYAAHNLLLETLVDFGVLGTLAVLAGVVLARISVPESSSADWHVLAFAWLGGGITEVISAPGRLFLLPGAFVVLFVFSSGQPFARLRRETAARLSRADPQSSMPPTKAPTPIRPL